jgi:hypothetical protein
MVSAKLTPLQHINCRFLGGLCKIKQESLMWRVGMKRPGHETDQSSLSSVEVKNGGAIPPLLLMSSRCSSPFSTIRSFEIS